MKLIVTLSTIGSQWLKVLIYAIYAEDLCLIALSSYEMHRYICKGTKDFLQQWSRKKIKFVQITVHLKCL